MKSLKELDWSEVKKTNKESAWREFNFKEYLETQENISLYLSRTDNATDAQIDTFWFDMREGRGDFNSALIAALPAASSLMEVEKYYEPTIVHEPQKQTIKTKNNVSEAPVVRFNHSDEEFFAALDESLNMPISEEIELTNEQRDVVSLEESLKEYVSEEFMLEKLAAGYFSSTKSMTDLKKDKEEKLLKAEKEKRAAAFISLKGNSEEVLSLIKKYTTPPAESESMVFEDDWSFEDECNSDFLIPDLGLAPEEAYVIVAPPFTGKSFFATHLILSVISGQKLFNHFEVARTGTALWLDYDSNIKERKKQIAQVAGGMGIAMSELSNKIEYAKPNWKFNDSLSEEKFAKLCEGRAICIVDTISGSFIGDENTPDYGKIVDMANRVSAATNCTVVFLAHTPKGWKFNGNNGDSAIRGHSSVLGTAGGNWILQRDGSTCQIICHKNRKFKFDNFNYTYHTEGNFLKKVGCFEKVVMEYKEAGDCSGPNEDNKEQIEVFEAIKSSTNGLKKEDIKKLIHRANGEKTEVLNSWIAKGLILENKLGTAKYCTLTSDGEKIIKPAEKIIECE